MNTMNLPDRIGRYGRTLEIRRAAATAFLLSDREAGLITGQTLYVDGGYPWAV